ncbi:MULTISPECIES: response regulator [unclassified Mucilaginibacter]|uniref:response regulator n=1 Tax=unclassified Mucilaginibacter TaxID=2617802 RepID=UPI002AC89B58|nr:MULTISPECIES: response regulator [unclassified Mucilaginibacter]MEB0263752.1 response regulator [Mucilaginibacter sp. 10I4]MEB0278554.1 response regulator [Mucilaginibacter sp. 10B2]MEB0299265.1 response regulator [Mucilaginibacter sp. 5C4]WPX23489.1 response regulator [Mucilaginibacter sp. 5C4]
METLASQKSILILDKDNRILSVVDDIMQLGNYDIHITFDPNAVFDKAKALKPDLVILDYLLLNNECADICRDFKDDAEMHGVPLIVVTAYKTKKTRDDAYNCDALFVKPLDISLFASSVNYMMAS